MHFWVSSAKSGASNVTCGSAAARHLNSKPDRPVYLKHRETMMAHIHLGFNWEKSWKAVENATLLYLGHRSAGNFRFFCIQRS
jgi:hypothetical protein